MGLSGVGGWITQPGACTLKVAIDEASKKESDQEVVANNLDVHPQVYGLHVSVDIVEQVPEKIKV